VFFVDDDQLQMRQRCQNCQPRAQNDAGPAQMCRQPVEGALAFRQPAVEADHIEPRKARADIRLQLRRQVDFRHQNQNLRQLAGRICRRQNPGCRLQVDFGLATARHAVQQQGRKTFGFSNGTHGLLLFRVELRRVDRTGVMLGNRFRQLLQGAVECYRFQDAQILRQSGQRHLTQRALVVVCRKTAQGQPLRRQRRQLAAHCEHILELGFRYLAVSCNADDHPGRLAPAEWHDGQLSDLRQRFRSGLTPPVIEGQIKRGIERDLENAMFHELNVIPEKVT